MAQVHFVKAARKTNPVAKKGESYYWWKFRYGGKHYSKTKPRPSQLTQSAYYGTVRALIEQIEDASFSDPDEFESFKQEICDSITDLRDETQSSLDNMPEGLQRGSTGEMLQERIDALDNADSEIFGISEFDFEEEEFDEDDFDAESDDDIDEMREAHQKEEEDRRQSEFDDWLSGAIAEMMEAVANCEI